MTGPNTEFIDGGDTIEADRKAYVIGFVLSLLLTAAAFGAALSDLSFAQKGWLIGLAAVLQVTAHLRYFLHIRLNGSQEREDLLLILFSSLLLIIMVAGTIWVLGDLEDRMHSGAPHATGSQM